jgi:hypothetical protein
VEVEDLAVVQMLGGLGVVEQQTTGLAEELARVLRARVIRLLAPAIVAREADHRALTAAVAVRQGLRHLRSIDVAVVGIGAVAGDVALVERGYLAPRHMRQARRMGAVGEILVQFLSADGRVLAHPSFRVIGFPLAELPRLPLAIGVAAGPPDKSEAVLAALRGRLLHVLVTDAGTAQRVLDLADGAATAPGGGVRSGVAGSRPLARHPGAAATTRPDRGGARGERDAGAAPAPPGRAGTAPAPVRRRARTPGAAVARHRPPAR